MTQYLYGCLFFCQIADLHNSLELFLKELQAKDLSVLCEWKRRNFAATQQHLTRLFSGRVEPLHLVKDGRLVRTSSGLTFLDQLKDVRGGVPLVCGHNPVVVC